MMGLVRQWLIGLTWTARGVALAQALAPEGSVKKVCKLAGGLALLLAAVSPLFSLEDGAVTRVLEEYRAAMGQCEDSLAERTGQFYQSIIEEETAAYIVDKAEELGIICQAEVTLAYDEDGTPYPWEIAAWGEWTQEGQSRLSALLEQELGVPASRQYYGERTP